MKVLYITNNAKMYGANLCLYEMVIDLRGRYGIEPIILVKEKGDLTEILEKEGIVYKCMPFSNALRNNGVNYLKDLYWYVRDVLFPAYKIAKEIKNEKIDIVHSGTSVIDIGFYISRILKVHHVWHVRETEGHYNFKFICPNRILKHMYSDADIIVTISRFVRERLQQKVGILDNTQVIYDGINVDEFYNQNEKKFLTDNRVKFCIVGLVYKNKNQYKVLQACHELCQRGITNFELYIVGDGEQLEVAKLKKYVALNNLEDNVFFLGYRHDINEILRTMDVGIMASKMEGFGRVTIEYMTHYMPVIASNSGANIELVKNEESGLIFELDDELELVDCMQYYINNPKEIERMGKSAYEYACKKFTVYKNSDSLYSLYNSILK